MFPRSRRRAARPFPFCRAARLFHSWRTLQPFHSRPATRSVHFRRAARRWLAPFCFGLAAVVLASPAGAAGDPPTSQPLGADPWLGPIGTTALYAVDEPTGSRRGLWLGVSAGVARSAGERERLFGLLELGLGLDMWAAADGSAALAAASDEDAEVDADAAPDFPSASTPGRLLPPPRYLATESAPRAAESRPGAAGPPAPAGGEGCEGSRSCDPAAVAALARALVAEALRVQGGRRELRRLDGMAARSRAAAALPEVRLGAGTSRDESLRLSPTLADPARFTRDGGRDLWLEARLTWRLDGAIFARDEIAIMRLRAQQREEAARLTRGVLEALISLERARLLLASPTAPPDERDAAIVRQVGAVAELDVLTDGWFSRQRARARDLTRGGGAPPAWP